MAAIVSAIALAFASAAQAQSSQDQAAREANRRVAQAIIARDGMAEHWVDRSSARSVIVRHPASGLTCVDVAIETTRLSRIPPSPNVTSVACEIRIDTVQIVMRALTGAPDDTVMNAGLQATARVNSEAINGQPWTGQVTEVSGEVLPHPPYQIVRMQGIRDGAPVYYRFAWARAGDWWISQTTWAPLADQPAAELLASIHLYGVLTLADDEATVGK